MKIDQYIPIVGQSVIDDLKLIAGRLKGRRIQHINSTAVGGGVAEILNRMINLFHELGLDAGWDVIKGGQEFFSVTKKFHNVLHGRPDEVTKRDFDIFLETGCKNIEETNIYGDVVFIHDPQPIMLVNKRTDNKWVWRCHIDISHANKDVWTFLREYVIKYDGVIFSMPGFSKKLPNRQFLIPPSIDPLSEKNREMTEEEIEGVLRRFGISRDKPIVTQISRFDRLKDPLGVIEAYRLVKKYCDCRLILAGGGASDDPEGAQVLEEVKDAAKSDTDIHVLLLPQDDVVINALQRASTVIMQKSLREGFGLTISEALWKGKPVVASYVGGIPFQIKHKYSGLLCHSVEGAAFALKQLLNSPAYAKKLGENGKEHIRNNFLITRHLRDYILLSLALFYPQDLITL